MNTSYLVAASLLGAVAFAGRGIPAALAQTERSSRSPGDAGNPDPADWLHISRRTISIGSAHSTRSTSQRRATADGVVARLPAGTQESTPIVYRASCTRAPGATIQALDATNGD